MAIINGILFIITLLVLIVFSIAAVATHSLTGAILAVIALCILMNGQEA